MRHFLKKTITILTVLLVTALCSGVAGAGVWEFGTSGTGQNPFTPRGYLIDTGSGVQFLSSQFSISSSSVKYTGSWNGVDYIDAEKKGGGTYTFYAMTDRNPWPKSESYLGYGKLFLFAYENGRQINNFASYVSTPPSRAGSKDPTGGRSWAFEINGLQLKPGSIYEFGYLCGMQANNGVTLAPAFNENGSRVGYISQTGGEISSEELTQYEEWKNEEYQFVSSWKKTDDGYDVRTVPMRFVLKTYADMSRFEQAAAEADAFTDSVTEQDIRQGKYRQENVDAFEKYIESLKKAAREQVRYMRQDDAEQAMNEMVGGIEELLNLVKEDKPLPGDLSELNSKIRTAEELLNRAGNNIGSQKGQYGREEVEGLQTELGKARQLHKYSPQAAINDEAQQLQTAIDAVVESRIREDQRVFYDKVTGIYVIAPAASVPRKTTFAVRQMGGNTAAFKSVRKHLNMENTEVVYYKMGLYEGDRKIQPTQQVEVQIPVENSIGTGNCKVYTVGSKGGLHPVTSQTADGTAVFKTGKVSDFVLTASAVTEEEKAKARSRKFKELMEQRKVEQANQQIIELQKEKQRKEDYKDPVDRMLQKTDTQTPFMGDVRRRTSPVYVLIIAAALGAAAIAFGIRGIVMYRRRRYE